MKPDAHRSNDAAAYNGPQVKGWQLFPACLTVFALLLAGCATEESRVVSLRERLLVVSEPSGTTTIATAKDEIEEHSDVSIVAQVLDDEIEAFVDGQAAFLVTEVCADEGQCENKGCKFCKARKAKSLNAAVQFVDESGEPIAVDARELFGIRPGDTIVIQGKAEVMPGVDMLQVTGKHIFIGAKEQAPS